jgi:uncharacterized protein (TIGR00255 family)
MIRSMTGFGEAELVTAAGLLRVELRTVNHRYLNVNARLPSPLTRFEIDLREWLRSSFVRGHVNCSVRIESTDQSVASGVALDEQKVAAYLRVFTELGERFGVTGTPDIALLTRFSDVLVRDEQPEAIPVEAQELREAVDSAARQANVIRDEGGHRLQVDLEERLLAVSRELDAIQARAPHRLELERDRLRAAVRELADGLAIDDARLAQEIAFLAERWDINEELVRFRSHIELFRELVALPAPEAVGKRLGFLVQEMHREANTIGSKANDAVIVHHVISIKEEVERLREQVENVE